MEPRVTLRRLTCALALSASFSGGALGQPPPANLLPPLGNEVRARYLTDSGSESDQGHLGAAKRLAIGTDGGALLVGAIGALIGSRRWRRVW